MGVGGCPTVVAQWQSTGGSSQRCPGSVYFCAIPSSSPVQNELSLTTPKFSLFVLELPFPNRKAEVIFHYSFWNFRSQIEKRKLICHNLFWNKSKNRALSVLELALQIEERTLKQKLDSQFDTELGLEVEKTNVTSP